MDEHDDDLTSEIQDEATEETDTFPATADDLEDDDDTSDSDGLEIDEDESEL
jgi:hypothetical protein